MCPDFSDTLYNVILLKYCQVGVQKCQLAFLCQFVDMKSSYEYQFGFASANQFSSSDFISTNHHRIANQHNTNHGGNTPNLNKRDSSQNAIPFILVFSMAVLRLQDTEQMDIAFALQSKHRKKNYLQPLSMNAMAIVI